MEKIKMKRIIEMLNDINETPDVNGKKGVIQEYVKKFDEGKIDFNKFMELSYEKLKKLKPSLYNYNIIIKYYMKIYEINADNWVNHS